MDSFCSLFDPNEGISKPKKDHKPDAKKLGDAPKGRRRSRRSRSKKETLPEESSFLCEPDLSTDLLVKDRSYIESYIDVGFNDTSSDNRLKRRNSRKTRRKHSKTSDEICNITDDTCKNSDVSCNDTDDTCEKTNGPCSKSIEMGLNNQTMIQSVFNDVGKNVNDLKSNVFNEGLGVHNAIERLEIVGLKDDTYTLGELSAEDLESDVSSEDETEDTFSDSECRGESEESFGSLPPEPRFGNVEYKLQLVSPGERRLQHLVTQLKWRLRSGGGTAIYVLGVTDGGALRGLSPRALRASLRTLRRMASSLGADLLHLQARRLTHNRAVAELYIRKLAETQQSVELRIAVMGANEAGKSTLIGVLTQGELDNGRGSARLNMFRHVHEVRSGRTSSLSHEILGFDAQGNVVNYGCSELMTAERIGERSAKLVSFIDLAGHRKYQRTTVHGLTGYSPHYAMLVVSCTGGITHITEEHMSLLVALELPFFIVLTKAELRPTGVNEILEALTTLLHTHGKKPILITDEAAARTCVAPKKLIINALNEDEDMENNNNDNDAMVPVFPVSCVRGCGLGALHSYLLALLPPNEQTPPHQDESCEFQIDEIFHVGESTGPVVGGLLARGKLYEGDQLLVGPLDTGEFVQISVKTIYRNRVPCDFVKAGQSASLGLSHYPPNLRQGMVLLAIPTNYKHNATTTNQCTPTKCKNYHQNAVKASSKKFNRKNKNNLNNNIKNVEKILVKHFDSDINENLLKCESSSDDKSDSDMQEKDSSKDMQGLSDDVLGLSKVQGLSSEQNFEQCVCSDELILDDPDNPRGCLYFQASIRLLRHSTSYIYPGFQCTVHIGNVRQTAIIQSILSSDGVLRSGEKASVVFRFSRNPEYIRPYRRMLCRAGHYTTAVGRLVQVFPYVTCQT